MICIRTVRQMESRPEITVLLSLSVQRYISPHNDPMICTLSVGAGKEQWGAETKQRGAETGKEYYRFHIKSILRKE